MKHILSKSTFMYGCQCQKRLYLHKFKPELKNPEDENRQAIFQTGTYVGILARQLFDGGVDASPPDTFSYHISVKNTQHFLQTHFVIYEAAFQFEGVLCAIDILVRKKNKWYAYEVKSSTSVKPQYIDDAALQYYVMKNSGLQIEDISIVYLNNEYVRNGNLEIEKLFATQSVIDEVLEKQRNVAEKIIELKKLLENKQEPVIEIGKQCFDPYECDFTNYCWKNIPKENSIFDLTYGLAWKLYDEGIYHLDEIPDDFKLSAKAEIQLKHYKSGEIFCDKEAIKNFTNQFEYPLYFFDFETFNSAIPELNQSKTYQQIPFQFSLHIQKNKGEEVEHVEFLGDGISDPRIALIKSMLKHLGKSGNIVCYNKSFEQTRIKEMALNFPEYENELLALNERVVDLMEPFQKRWYYHPNFKGGYSIKIVLPTLISELSYNNLEIKEGGTASFTYSQLRFQDKATQQLQRNQLLDYCKLDTFAMVKIWEWLIKI
ncbi:MAG: DUF2779 domain-containing protein [Bacteroidota bacterium]